MKELLKEIDSCVSHELERANAQFPLFHSNHEAYGVIKEELEEMKHEENMVEISTDDQYWNAIRSNMNKDNLEEYLSSVKKYAENCAAEACQVAAMAQKAIDSMNQEQK